jgi:DNA-binding MarR family transcriptional regulator
MDLVKPYHLRRSDTPGDDVADTIDIQEASPAADLFPDDRSATTGVLLDANALIGAAIAKLAVDPAGLDPSMADLLVRLAKSPTCGIRGVDIGEQCQMTATRVSRLLDRAEAEGMVKRLPDPSDRRAQHVVLTEKGLAAVERLAPLMNDVLDTLVFETLTAKERATLIELLARLRDRAQWMLDEA